MNIFRERGPKGIQHWYSTRELVDRVTATMDRFESLFGYRRCPINGRHMLQIRGKHLRRLLKQKPEWCQKGRYIVEAK